jgi:hypothetical protein
MVRTFFGSQFFLETRLQKQRVSDAVRGIDERGGDVNYLKRGATNERYR